MDAFAITGVSPDQQWFRVEGAVGGEIARARLYPRMHVVSPTEIADMANGGRRIYFSQAEADAPLVPLSPADAAEFDPAQVVLEELPRFAFLEHATEEDIDALLAVRTGALPPAVSSRLGRLEALGWVERDGDDRVTLTALGAELLRHGLA